MSENTKKFTNLTDFHQASKAMNQYQKIHNLIRLDYIELLKLTENSKNNKIEFDALYRASLKSLFTIIEADIYGLNNIDPYNNYSDRHSFEYKFKETFKQVCNTWNKVEICQTFFNTKYKNLKELRKRRDELVHPKNVAHIHEASENEFIKLKKGFTDYDDFINQLMDNFFIGMEINIFDILKK